MRWIFLVGYHAVAVLDSRASAIKSGAERHHPTIEEGSEVFEDFDDGLVAGARSVRKDEWLEVSVGIDRARQWEKCTSVWKNFNHSVDAVVSRHHNLAYLDNVKAGSSTLREMFSKQLGIGWDHSDLPVHGLSGECCGRGALQDYDFDSIKDLFKFSFVRDPVAKFESGVRQIYKRYSEVVVRGKKLGSLTADQILDLQLEMGESAIRRNAQRQPRGQREFWLNVHVEPSSWRVSAWMDSLDPRGAAPAKLDFIGQIEEIEQDWPFVVERFTNINASARAHLLNLLHANAGQFSATANLSPEGVKKMCASRIYRPDWECFGYALPDVCK